MEVCMGIRKLSQQVYDSKNLLTLIQVIQQGFSTIAQWTTVVSTSHGEYNRQPYDWGH